MDQHKPGQPHTLQGCHTCPCETFVRVPAAARARLKVQVLPAQSPHLVGFEPPKREIAVHIDISLHFTFGVILYLSGWMIFKSISNSPRTNKASRMTKQTTRICWRKRTDNNPFPAWMDRQEEPRQPSPKHATTPCIPSLAGCISWSFLLLPPRIPTPTAHDRWVILAKSRPYKTAQLPPNLAFSHHLTWGISGSRRRGRARASSHAVLSAHRGLSPLRKHLHQLQSSLFPTGRPRSEAAAAVAGTVSAQELSAAPRPP